MNIFLRKPKNQFKSGPGIGEKSALNTCASPGQVLRQPGSGFTVMEVVVSAGIFAVVMTIIFGIFSVGLRGQQTALAHNRLQREAQLIMEVLAKKIRTSRLNYAHSSYASSPSIAVPTSTLTLIDTTDTVYKFRHNSAAQTLDLSVNNGPIQAITTSQVDITKLDFFITPTTDPFQPGFVPTEQPRITIVLTLTATLGDTVTSLTLEQTIPQRGGIY